MASSDAERGRRRGSGPATGCVALSWRSRLCAGHHPRLPRWVWILAIVYLLAADSGVDTQSNAEEIEMYKRILMAYDGSPEYRRALRQGTELAEITNAESIYWRSSALRQRCRWRVASPSEVVNEEHSEVKKLLEEGVERIKERRHVECTAVSATGSGRRDRECRARLQRGPRCDRHAKLGGLDRWWRKRIGKI